eukprot:m.27615 g.27615  ORF g.27615 m.27615 type:complete len:280 (-) comp5960_c0_seq1:75-914(-)
MEGVLAEVSSAEKEFIVGGVDANIRIDGRSREERRPLEVQSGVVSNANGSARAKLMGTDILVGVKLEVSDPISESPDEGVIEFLVSASRSSVSGLGGRSGGAITRTLTSLLETLHMTASPIDMKALCIISGEAVWHIKVDILVLQCLGGNIAECMIAAVKAALEDTTIPNSTVVRDSDGNPVDFDLSSDPFDVFHLEGAKRFPTVVHYGVIGNRYFLDPTLEEEACCDSVVLVGISGDGDVVYTKQHSMRRGVNPSELVNIVLSAKRAWSNGAANLDAM